MNITTVSQYLAQIQKSDPRSYQNYLNANTSQRSLMTAGLKDDFGSYGPQQQIQQQQPSISSPNAAVQDLMNSINSPTPGNQQLPNLPQPSISPSYPVNNNGEEFINPRLGLTHQASSGIGSGSTAGGGGGTQYANAAPGSSEPGGAVTFLPASNMPSAASIISSAAHYAMTPEDLNYQRGRTNIKSNRKGILSTLLSNKPSSNPLVDAPTLLGA